MNKKIISFSVWGNNPKYTVGAIKNAELLQSIYPGWIARFYVGQSVPDDIVKQLSSFDNVEVKLMDEEGSWNSMFWRFKSIDEPDVMVNLSRDTDSRLSKREKVCVDEFMMSDKLFHNILDHPYHGGIMGGMHGIKKGCVNNLSSYIDSWSKSDQWQTDQQFLNNVIAPMLGDKLFVHDGINKKNIPVERENHHFIGEIFDGNDNRADHYTVFL